MRVILAQEVARTLSFRDLIETLRVAFRTPTVTPLRHHHTIERGEGGADTTLLLMPAWADFAAQGHSERGYIGIKIVTVNPDNAARGLPSVAGAYLLMSGKSGMPLAMIDGQALTLWRTAAASALASTYLSREDSHRLLMVGAGALAPYLIRAHAAVRPITEVLIWNRTPDKAQKLAHDLASRRLFDRPVTIGTTQDLEGAVRGADIVSTATLSSEPLILGAWVEPGTHLDCVGAFTPAMREVDDGAVQKARLFCDTMEGALSEAGDLAQPLKKGVITRDDIAGDLCALTQGEKAGRRYYQQITLFKSVGTALEDLAAAALVFARSA